jgi:hypothetical protein
MSSRNFASSRSRSSSSTARDRRSRRRLCSWRASSFLSFRGRRFSRLLTCGPLVCWWPRAVRVDSCLRSSGGGGRGRASRGLGGVRSRSGFLSGRSSGPRALIDGTIALVARGLSRACGRRGASSRTGSVREGNAILNFLFAVSASCAGPALAGLVVAATSVSAALAIDAVSFALVALVLVTSKRAARGDGESNGRPWLVTAALGCGLRTQRPVIPHPRERAGLPRSSSSSSSSRSRSSTARRTLDAGDVGVRRTLRLVGRRDGRRVRPVSQDCAGDRRPCSSGARPLLVGAGYVATGTRAPRSSPPASPRPSAALATASMGVVAHRRSGSRSSGASRRAWLACSSRWAPPPPGVGVRPRGRF